ncbi:MAG TPA: ABC transporter permease [Microbacterium sp.]|uniref:ABC transporter permease n=1 Tax=Microbacterium sp. TaxID=51671 RepID=UPI002B7798BD|nr:ABC transporter permease [Microbacterium sp.]HWI30868.1 ABC transporter permease [Microbacterium sp.]
MTTTAVRSGFRAGLIELRQGFTGTALIGQLFWPVVTLVAIWFLRDLPFSGVRLGPLILPSTVGMFVALGMLLTVQQLAADREDGSLLRAKATPHGIRGYLVGKFVNVSATVVAYLLILLVPGALLIGGLSIDAAGVLTLAWVLALGFIATQALGAVLGASVENSRGAGVLSVPVIVLIAISGIFYPITALPEWLQVVGQIFPVYWLGLGVRSALLPEHAAALEIDQSWRHLETAAVLGAWAVAGLIVAPIVLRRMARRESGSRVARRRESLQQRVG